MKKILSLLSLIILLTSCSSDFSDQARDLLASIPSDVESVGIINMQSAIDAFDKGSNPVITSALKKGKFPTELANLKDGGVDVSAAAFFSRGSKIYITGFLSDEDKFCETYSKMSHSQFGKFGNVKILEKSRGGYCAVADDRFWIVSSGSPDADEIRGYLDLPESKSILKIPFAEALAEGKYDVRAIANLGSLLAMTGGETQMKVSVILNMLYDDPSYADLSLDLKKNVDINIGVLNSRYNPAKFILPLGEIDTQAVASLGGNANTIIAASLPGEVVKRLASQFDKLIPLAPLSAIDGTVCLTLGPDNKLLSGLIQTDGSDPQPLLSFLNSQGLSATPSSSGAIRIVPEDAAHAQSVGNLSVANTAKSFSGSYLAIESHLTPFKGAAPYTVTIRLTPSTSGSASFRLTIR
ncbi:MAG: hypothetical protein J6C81_07590 [Muribaculaceae bacterium]|nr:hypothetical protein [Muribaculaceae bacterium]